MKVSDRVVHRQFIFLRESDLQELGVDGLALFTAITTKPGRTVAETGLGIGLTLRRTQAAANKLLEIGIGELDDEAGFHVGGIPRDIAVCRNVERKKVRGFVYLLSTEDGHFKIGKSKDLTGRLKAFGLQLPYKYVLVHSIETPDYSRLEVEIHEHFASKRLNGEWFHLSTEDVAAFKNYKPSEAA